MNWTIIFHDAFDAEFSAFPRDVQKALTTKARLLEAFGPHLGRPHVDTLNDSKHANMKELRFDTAGCVWLLLSIRSVRPLFLLLVTSLAGVRSGFTAH